MGDLAWNVPEDQPSSDFYSPLLNELPMTIKQRTRSLDELTGSLSIDWTIPLMVPPVQYQNEKHGCNGVKEWEAARWNFSKHSNYFQEIEPFSRKHKSENTDKKMYRNDAFWSGKRNILAVNEETIMSKKGTVRGVKNRVRAGIATFLQDQTDKNYQSSERGKCVLYVTSLGICRQTKARCDLVRKILRNLMVRYDERDVFMSREHFHELSDRLSGLDGFMELPQLFLHGQLLGGSSVIECLNESGELRVLLKPLQVPVSVDDVCEKCGGFRMVPCTLCGGSKKSGLRSRLNIHSVMLRCAHCDQGGLARCDLC